MLVGIDAREFSVNRPGGLRTYTESILRSLANIALDFDIIAYGDRPLAKLDILGNIEYRVCPPAQLALREQIYLPKQLIRDCVDLAHFPANTAPLKSRVPFVLTLHDTFCIERPTWNILRHGSLHNKALSLYVKKVIRSAAKKSKHIITISEYSKNLIVKHLSISEDKITIIPPSINPQFRRLEDKEFRQYLETSVSANKLALIIGSVEDRKNTIGMIKAFQKALKKNSDIGLIVAWPASVDFESWARSKAIECSEKIKVMSGVDNETLIKLYSNVDIFMFLSQREGFGLPVIEAMACGCAVITSNTSALPETAGGAALIAEPANICDIAQKILEILGDNSKQNELRQKGLMRVREFADENIANKIKTVYLQNS